VEETRVEGFFVLLRKQIQEITVGKSTASFNPLFSTGEENAEVKIDREIDEENQIEKNPCDMLARST